MKVHGWRFPIPQLQVFALVLATIGNNRLPIAGKKDGLQFAEVPS